MNNLQYKEYYLIYRKKPWMRHFRKNDWVHIITLYCRPGPTKASWAG